MTVVSLASCSSYEENELSRVIEKSLSQIGFSGKTFQSARVAVKPNLLTAAKDDSAVITHPAFFRAVVRMVKAYGGTPVLVESPAVHSLERVIKKTGYARVVEIEKAPTITHGPERGYGATCPAEAIGPAETGRSIPAYDYGRCICCYCCLEICPESAIEKKQGRLQWMLDFFSS